jgi:sugar phosphate isomerase/epimerase
LFLLDSDILIDIQEHGKGFSITTFGEETSIMATPTRTTRRLFLARAAAIGAAGAAFPGILSSGTLEGAAAPDAGPWQIGIYTRPFGQYQYPVALDAIAEAGYKYLGLMTIKSKNSLVVSMESTLEEAERVRVEASNRGLTIVSVYGGGFPVRKDSLEPGIKGLKKLIDNVAACGCGNLLLGGTGGKDQQEPYYKTVRECCDYAAEKKVEITLKPHGPLNATGPECRKYVEMVGKKNFGVWYDPGNVAFYSEGKLDPVKDVGTVDGLVRGMSVKDYRAPKRVDVTPGTGQVDFPGVMARLAKGGFTSGPLVIECLSPGDLKALVQEAKNARRFVEQLVRARAVASGRGAGKPQPASPEPTSPGCGSDVQSAGRARRLRKLIPVCS